LDNIFLTSQSTKKNVNKRKKTWSKGIFIASVKRNIYMIGILTIMV